MVHTPVVCVLWSYLVAMCSRSNKHNKHFLYKKYKTTNILECVAPKLRRTSTPRVCTFLKKGLLQAARAPLLHNALAPKHIEEEQPTPLRCFLCVLREQCPLMGLPSSGISSTDGAPLVYVASESTALNTLFQSLESCYYNEEICLNSCKVVFGGSH